VRAHAIIAAAMDQNKNHQAPAYKTHRRNQSTVSCKSFAGQLAVVVILKRHSQKTLCEIIDLNKSLGQN
jgi:hypothetical protein